MTVHQIQSPLMSIGSLRWTFLELGGNGGALCLIKEGLVYLMGAVSCKSWE